MALPYGELSPMDTGLFLLIFILTRMDGEASLMHTGQVPLRARGKTYVLITRGKARYSFLPGQLKIKRRIRICYNVRRKGRGPCALCLYRV